MAATVMGVTAPVTPAAAGPTQLSTSPDVTWDAINADPNVDHTGQLRFLVWDLQEYDGKMFVAGKFLQLKSPTGATVDQAYLAAFDLVSGDLIESFAPNLDGAVYSMSMADDGRIIVGGEFTGGVAAIDPATGNQDPGFNASVDLSWGNPAVFDVEVDGNKIYAGGRFDTADGSDLQNLARLDTNTGILDTDWNAASEFDTGTPVIPGQLVFGLSVDHDRDRVYVVGKFGSLNGNLDAAYFGTLNTTDGAVRADLPQGIPPFVLNHRLGFSMWQHDVQWSGDRVYVGGQGHQTLILDAATLTPHRSFFANRGRGDANAGGDTQVIFIGQNTIYAGCHCWGSVGEYEIGTYIADPAGQQTYAEYVEWVFHFRDTYPANEQVDARGLYTLDRDNENLDPWVPSLLGQGGAYAIYEDSNGRVWVGGQFTRNSAQNTLLTGLTRFSPAGQVQAPLGLRTTYQSKHRVVLNWYNIPVADHYEVYRDGALVGTSNNRWYTDLGLDEGTTYSYTVRSVTAAGATSSGSLAIDATTAGVQVNPAEAPASCDASANGTAADITWEASADAVDYRIYRSVNGSPDYWRGKVTGTSFADTLRPTGEHIYSVQARGNDGVWSSSTICAPAITAGAAGPSVPTGFVSTLQTKERAVLHWDAQAGVDHWDVYQDGNLVGDSTNRWYTDLGLTSATTYSYTLVAVAANGTESAPTAAISVTTN